jgi:hypothetical protein
VTSEVTGRVSANLITGSTSGSAGAGSALGGVSSAQAQVSGAQAAFESPTATLSSAASTSADQQVSAEIGAHAPVDPNAAIATGSAASVADNKPEDAAIGMAHDKVESEVAGSATVSVSGSASVSTDPNPKK